MSTRTRNPTAPVLTREAGGGVAVMVRRPADLRPGGEPGAALIAAFLAGRSERTRRAYAGDLGDFRAFLGASDLDAAAAVLLSGTHGEANALALAYRAHLVERGLSPNTTNRRLASVRSLVKLGRTLGLVPWTLEVGNLKARAYRDTRGPGRDGLRRMLDALDAKRSAKALRDRAAVRLLYDLALRRAEVVALDLADVEADAVHVLGKGRTQTERLTLPDRTAAALAEWLEVRGTHPGPLFTNFDRAGKGSGRLSGTSLYRIVRELGEEVGIVARPHGLRHAAITRMLDLTSGNVRSVKRFSRHSKLDTLMVYDDNRADVAGELARLLVEDAAA